jgi:Ca2+-binding RTX toxin-like protein
VQFLHQQATQRQANTPGDDMLQFLFNTTSLNFLYTASTYFGTARNDFVFSSGLNDTISTGDGNDYVDSGAGNDVVTLGNGNDIAFAGNGNDTVDGGAGNDSIFGGNGNDTLDGGAGDDSIDGGAGNDIIRAGDGNDFVNAGSGNDTVFYTANAASGNDTINGGAGTDTLVLELTAAQQASAAFLSDKAAFTAYLAAGGNGAFQFNSIGLRVTGGFEQLRIDTIGGPAVNTPPVVSGAVTLPAGTEDTSLTITAAQLLANVTDAEGNALSVLNVQASSGTVINNGNGTWTFAPDANANGTVTFTYTVSDGLLSTAATATVVVAAVNDGPVAGAAVVLPALAEDTSVTITAAQLLANASDIDSASLSVQNLTASSGTLVNNNNGTWTFTPAANEDTAVTFTYQISDGQASVAGSASLDITAVNDGPVAGAAIVLPALAEDTSVTITAAQLLANASDIDSATLSVQNLTASSGTLVNNNNGTWTFTPAANDDTAVTFTYQISDSQASVAGSASLDITAVNDGPVAGAAVVLPALAEDTSVTITAAQLLTNASDIDSASLSVQNLTASTGTLVNNNNGTWTFTPAANDDTAVTFTYQITDGQASVAGSASLDITAVNDGPVAGAAVVLPALAEDTSVTITAAQLLANASDIDSATLSVQDLAASTGTLVNNNNGTWTFTPAANDDTAVTFTYQISDGELAVAGSATLDLTPVNDAPVAGAPIVLPAINEEETLTITRAQLLANASDIDSVTLSVQNLAASSGTLVANENGTWTFTPDVNDDTAVTFTYQISDGQTSVAGAASLDLIPVNDLPEIDFERSNLNIDIPSGYWTTGTIFASDVETPASELTYQLYLGSEINTLGTVVVSSNGNYRYDAPGDIEGGLYVGPDSFQVIVTDADGGTSIATVNINVDIDYNQINNIDGNANSAGQPLVGTFLTDVFDFVNYRTRVSGADVIQNFTQGIDIIQVTGFQVYVNTTEPDMDANGNFVYSIGFGSTITSSIALAASDFKFSFFGTEGNDILAGGVRDDFLDGYEGDDTISGGSGDDRLFGSEGDDAVNGDEGDDFIEGGEGDDTLDGGAGSDILFGDLGNDTLTGGAGADVFHIYTEQFGTEQITDFVSGEDKLKLFTDVDPESDPGVVSAFLAGVISNADGSFTYNITSNTSITVNTALAEGDIIFDIPNDLIEVTGTANDDANLNGTIFGDQIVGLEGNDTINGLSGNDTIIGGAGDDVLTGGSGNDTFEFSASAPGNDVITDFDLDYDFIIGETFTSEEDFLATVVENDGAFTYTFDGGGTLTTNVQLTEANILLFGIVS